MQLIGQTINLENIPQEELKRLHENLAWKVEQHRKERPVDWKGEDADMLTATIRAILKVQYKYECEWRGTSGV